VLRKKSFFWSKQRKEWHYWIAQKTGQTRL